MNPESHRGQMYSWNREHTDTFTQMKSTLSHGYASCCGRPVNRRPKRQIAVAIAAIIQQVKQVRFNFRLHAEDLFNKCNFQFFVEKRNESRQILHSFLLRSCLVKGKSKLKVVSKEPLTRNTGFVSSDPNFPP